MSVFCSTIIATIGRASLTRAVESVLSQKSDGFAFEVIVVNDSGIPLTPAEWQWSDRVRILETDRKERCIARNKGAEIARGMFLHFLDDDDRLRPGGLEKLHQSAHASSEDWLYGATQLEDRKGRELITLKHALRGNCSIQAMAGEWIPLQSSLIKAEVFRRVGGFNPDAVGREDIDLLRRVSMRADLKGIPEIVASVGIGREESSTDCFKSVRNARAAREQILDSPVAFQRLWQSAHGASWQGRLVRAYLTSMLWNLRRGRIIKAASRFGQALKALLLSWRHGLSRHFLASLVSAYESETFLEGFREVRRSVERRGLASKLSGETLAKT